MRKASSIRPVIYEKAVNVNPIFEQLTNLINQLQYKLN